MGGVDNMNMFDRFDMFDKFDRFDMFNKFDMFDRFDMIETGDDTKKFIEYIDHNENIPNSSNPSILAVTISQKKPSFA